MEIVSIAHRGLKNFVEDDDAKGLPPDKIGRIRNIIAQLVAAADIQGVEGPPGWRLHQLKGERQGVWSISVSGNWRITFQVEGGAITNLSLEDYH